MSKKRFISFILSLVMISSLFLPVVVSATPSEENNTTNVTIHKLQMSNDSDLDSLPQAHNGKELTSEEINALGNNVKPLEGVTFKYWIIPDNVNLTEIDLNALSVAELDDNYELVLVGPTDKDGKVEIKNLSDGRYYFREIEAPENVTDYVGVPFLLELPLMKTDGTGFIKDLHIYPKNITVYGSVILNKYDGDAEEGTRLEGAKFDLYKEMSEGNYVMYRSDLVTNANGQIAVKNLPVGAYYFIEKEAPEGYELKGSHIDFSINENGEFIQSEDGFYVNKDNSGTVTLEFKNYKSPVIEKYINEVGKTQDSASFGEEISWIIKPILPGDINTYEKFVVTDEIDSKLDYVSDSLIITANNGDERVVLVEGTHYTVNEPSGPNGGTLVIEFIFSKESPNSSIMFSDLEISFKTTINESAEMGVPISNSATLTYNNGYTVDKETSSDPRKVFTGGAKFIKKAENEHGNVLKGAEFVVRNLDGEYLKINNDIYSWTGNIGDASRLTSTDDGKLEIKGLKYDLEAGTTYQLIETKAPMGPDGTPYNLLKEPVEFVINADSYDDAKAMIIINKMGPTIPKTGGIGTLAFSITGLGLMGSATIFLKKKKYKDEK